MLSVPLDLLACPIERAPLRLVDGGRELVSPGGRRYPIVDGVPVLLHEERPATAEFVAQSLVQAWRHARGEAPDGPGHGAPLFASTLGIADDKRRDLAARAHDLGAGGDGVDPVVAELVAATNGIAYLGTVGALARLPLPAPPLPRGRGERVLDVGCSWGRWSLSLARQGYRVVGVDPSLGAIMAARRTAQREGLADEVAFIVGDARCLGLADASCDRAFSYSVLQHFAYEDAADALREIGRVLRPGGAARVQMPNALGVRSIQHQARRRFRPARDFEVRYWTLGRLRAACEQAIGPTAIDIDCFFGLGLQPTDLAFMTPAGRAATRASEALKRVARAAPWLPLVRVADSVWLDATRRA